MTPDALTALLVSAGLSAGLAAWQALKNAAVKRQDQRQITAETKIDGHAERLAKLEAGAPHAERIARLESESENTRQDVTEIKEELSDISKNMARREDIAELKSALKRRR